LFALETCGNSQWQFSIEDPNVIERTDKMASIILLSA